MWFYYFVPSLFAALLVGASPLTSDVLLERSPPKGLTAAGTPARPPNAGTAAFPPKVASPSPPMLPVITPKVFIINMFRPEAEVWFNNAFTEGSIGNLLAQNITVQGFSPTYPDAHCLADASVCQLTTGESEINAASTITALMLSPLFNLRKTYFLIAGIAGINPKQGTIADVALARFAVQVALQYEFDIRDVPDNFTTGYVPQGTQDPNAYPQSIYGTEVFEVNEALRDIAAEFASTAKLQDSSTAKAYRKNYEAKEGPNIYAAATKDVGILKCDVATSDVYYSGTHLGERFENTTRVWTNGTGNYCMTAQEDNATLEAMIRFAKSKVIDFARIIIMRSGSDFERPYPGLNCISNLFYTDQGAFLPAIANLYLAGNLIVKGILEGWSAKFEAGITPTNYIGDILGTLGGTATFGPGPDWTQKNAVTNFDKRGRDAKNSRVAYRRVDMKGRDGMGMARMARNDDY